MEHHESSAASRAASMERLVKEVRSAGNCSHPVRLRGELINLATGEIRPSSLRVACKDRRSVHCLSCSALYQADAWIQVAVGLNGGKGVPESVATHPQVFLTLTAPSVGPVHRRTPSGRCQFRELGPCPHGRSVRCRLRHDNNADVLGTPICEECFDYSRAVLWNAQCSKLWNRTVQEMRRRLKVLATKNDTEPNDVSLSYLKVAEFQRRGLVHFHVVLRLDGGGDQISPPPPWLSSSMLANIVSTTVPHVHWTGHDGHDVVWGEQFDLADLTSSGEQHRRIASYLAKYATKTTDDSLGLARRFRSRADIEHAQVEPHRMTMALTSWDLAQRPEFARLRLAHHAHALGYTGQIITKSRHFSVTFASLREVRADFQRSRSDGDPTLAHLHYDGRGYDDPRAQHAAEMFHRMKVELRQEAAARRRQVAAAVEVDQ